jgi:hypothetical protein
MRTIERIVIEDDGYEYLSPEYNEAVETRTAEAMAECQDDCGDCTTADPVVVSGSDAITSSSSTQYTASGGIGPYTWDVSGEGATIDETGRVTLGEDACGGFTVTATDTCGTSDSLSARVTDRGMWGPESVICEPPTTWDCSTWGGSDCIIEATYHNITCSWYFPPGKCDACRDVSSPCLPCDGVMERYIKQEWTCPEELL